MELYKIRGGSREALESNEYNICVGISLGNKWFTPENIVGQIKWSLQYTKERVIACPADDIHAINIQVRGRKNKEKSKLLAKKMSNELMSKVKEEVQEQLTEEEQTKVIFATWADVVDENYKKKVECLYGEFEKNSEFRTAIQNIVRNGVSKEVRVFSEDDINLFSTYLLEEIPEITARVPIKGYTCDAYTYPFDVPLGEFVEQIQNGDLFPEIREAILDSEPKVFIAVR